MVDDTKYSERSIWWWARIRVGLMYIGSIYFLVGAYIFTELEPNDGKLAMVYAVIFLICLGFASKEYLGLKNVKRGG